MIFSADTNLFLHAANPDSPHHQAAREFFATANEKHFGGFGFKKVWNPLLG